MTIPSGVARALVAAGAVALVAVPALVHRGEARLSSGRKTGLERVLLGLVSIGFLASLVWVATPLLDFADYPLQPPVFIAGAGLLLVGLWLLYRSHVDLGAGWSITLELGEDHRLVTQGLYRNVRHPMYLALLVYAFGQGLVLPNWLAGPAYLAALLLLVGFRIGPEERMMEERFGAAYRAYRARTGRLLPVPPRSPSRLLPGLPPGTVSPGQELETRMLAEGDLIPDVTLTGMDGQSVSLSAFRGNKLVLYFYPKDDTSGCTREAKEFTALAGDFEKAGTWILGVSKDDPKSHAKFTDKYELGIKLASDLDGSVCEAFGTWGQKSLYGRKYMGIDRATFLIDRDGTLARAWRKVKVPGHVEEVLAAARALP
jgi:thioredoxin-dependent peroxiredoxin